MCGQALSHCVNFTLSDILATWPADRHHQIHLLTDGEGLYVRMELLVFIRV